MATTNNAAADVLFFEAIETNEGRVILRTGDTKEIILALEFADSANSLLQGAQTEIAKAMIDAGVQMAGRIIEQNRGYDCASYLIH